MNTIYQLSKVNKSLKTVKDPKIQERLLIVKSYYQQGNFRDAGKYHGCSYVKVKFWKDRYEQTGLKGLKAIKQTGRPPKLDKGQAKIIKKR